VGVVEKWWRKGPEMWTWRFASHVLTAHKNSNRKMTSKGEEGALLALAHRDRVDHVALSMPAPNLGKFRRGYDKEFPVLERICIGPPPPGGSTTTSPVFPKTFQVPNVCHGSWKQCSAADTHVDSVKDPNPSIHDLTHSPGFPIPKLIPSCRYSPLPWHVQSLVHHCSSAPY
jgi:hypothetical protein